MDTLWNAKQVAEYLRCSHRQVTERYAAMPSFPAAIRLPTMTAGKGHLLFKAHEVKEWVEQHQEQRYSIFTAVA